MWGAALFILSVSTFHVSEEFYLPGLAPVNYCRQGENDMMNQQCEVSYKPPTTLNEVALSISLNLCARNIRLLPDLGAKYRKKKLTVQNII